MTAGNVLGNHLFQGEQVRLAADNPVVWAQAWSRWGRDSEFMRLMDTDPPIPWSTRQIVEWTQKDMEKEDRDELLFTIHTLDDDRLIGFVGMFQFSWTHGDAWVAIGLGEPECWGKGYGTDAMRVLLCYAFSELNLQRITLCVFDYNQRAIRSYEKAGFQTEGLVRGEFLRQGRRWDLIFMGILREDCERSQVGAAIEALRGPNDDGRGFVSR